MKVYVAGKFTDKATVRKVQEAVRKRGHTITYDWTQCADDADLHICADADVQGVKQADALIALFTDPHYAYRGTFTECGIALGAGVPVYAVCPYEKAECRSNCFFHATGIGHYSLLSAALQALN